MDSIGIMETNEPVSYLTSSPEPVLFSCKAHIAHRRHRSYASSWCRFFGSKSTQAGPEKRYETGAMKNMGHKLRGSRRKSAGRFAFLRSRWVWYRVGFAAAVIVALQLLVPYDRAFLFARVDGVSVGLKTNKEIAELLSDRYADAVVITTSPDTRTAFIDAGLKVDTEQSAQLATEYPLWQRFLPLSSLFRLASREYRSKVNYLKLSLEQWSGDIEARCKLAPRDAGVEIKDGRLSLVKSADGAECPRKDVIAQLKATPLSPLMDVSSAKNIIKPRRNNAAVSAQITKIEAVIAKGVRVQVLDATVMAEPSEIVSWLTFVDGDNNQLKLDVDPSRLQAFIARVQRPVYLAPGTTTITMRDGIETGRISGSNGRGIDSNDLVTELRAQLNGQNAITVTAKIATLPPRTIYSRSYTNSTAGLQALLNDIAGERGNMAIAVTEIDGQRRNVSANGDRPFHPASTYKLFMAYSVIKRIESGQLKWEDQINGTSVDECMTRMIVNSDNVCAEAFNERIGGWSATQTDVRSIGMSGTNLNLPEPVGTVKDQVLFLQKLHAGQLMKNENKDKLLALMKRQKYRAGIPAGVNFEVADKVGFLSGNLHDSGLVYSSHGVYALSIYSTGGSWDNIADAARRIESLLAS